jgi:hypothetical protein
MSTPADRRSSSPRRKAATKTNNRENWIKVKKPCAG